MKDINGNRVGMIHLNHRGYDVKYGYTMMDTYNNDVTSRSSVLEINFDDTHEIDMFIHILERMKNHCEMMGSRDSWEEIKDK